MPDPATEPWLTRASALETAGVIADVAIPLLARLLEDRELLGSFVGNAPLPATQSPFRLRFSIG
jgi:hypothetical protein